VRRLAGAIHIGICEKNLLLEPVGELFSLSAGDDSAEDSRGLSVNEQYFRSKLNSPTLDKGLLPSELRVEPRGERDALVLLASKAAANTGS